MTIRKSLLLIVFIILTLYYPVLFAQFNSVDDKGMVQSLLNSETFSFESVFIPGASGSYYRPVLLTSQIFDKYLSGFSPAFMHLHNILIHLSNSLIVFYLAYYAGKLKKINNILFPFSAAFIFAVHPINSEAVCWISGRTDLLAGFFIFASFTVLLKWYGCYFSPVIAAFLMLSGTFSKETAIFALPAFLAFPFFMNSAEQESQRGILRFRYKLIHLFSFVFAASMYFLFRHYAFSKGDTGISRVVSHVAGEDKLHFYTAMKILMKSIGFYFKKLLQPFPLNFGIIHVSDWYLLSGFLVIILILLLLLRRQLSGFFIVAAAMIGCSALLVPYLNMTWTPLAERYMYISSAFFTIGLIMYTLPLIEKYRLEKTATVFFLAIAVVFVWGTALRAMLWQDNLALYKDTLNKSPSFMPAKNEIANALFDLGRVEEASAIFKSFSASTELVNFQYGLANKAFALMNEGNYNEARKILIKTLENPGKHEVMILNRILEVDKSAVLIGGVSVLKVYDSSSKALKRLVEITGDPFYSYRLGVVNMQVGKHEEALAAFDVAVSKASPKAYYYEPARKLSEKMKEKTAR